MPAELELRCAHVRNIGRAEDVARARTLEAETRVLRSDVVDGDAFRCVLLDPREVVLPECRTVTMRKRSSSSRVTVKSHSIPPRALSIDVYVIAPTSRATRFAHSDSRNSPASVTGDLDFRERGLVEECRGLAAREMLSADAGDQWRPAHAARAQRLVAACGVRLEPVRALPARLLTERRAELL